MAAFCTCCGAEITLKAEACPVCGMPRHGMVPSGQSLILDAQTELSQEEVSIHSKRIGSHTVNKPKQPAGSARDLTCRALFRQKVRQRIAPIAS